MSDPEIIDAPEPAAEEPSLRDAIMDAVRTQREPEAAAAPEQEATGEAQEAAEADRADGRDEKGRFAPKPAGEAPKPDEPAKIEAAPPVADPATAVRPPPGWSPQSKADFGKLPAHVQSDIAKRETEISNGFAKLSEYKDLEPLAALAKQNGTTLAAAVNNYRHFEVQLQNDPLAGIHLICQRFGIDPAQLGQALTNGRSPQQEQQRQAPQIDPNHIARQAAETVRAQMEQERVSQSIAAFAADPKNIYFENVKPMMAKLAQAGVATTLDDLYDKACSLVPEVAALVSQRATAPAGASSVSAVDQARRAAKATTGAPAYGIKAATPALPANASLRDTIVAARDAHVGRA